MAVSYLRSCYSTQMSFFADNPALTTLVDWYFVDSKTPFVPIDNTFTSRNWRLTDAFWPQLGEVKGAPRPWRDGSPPVLASGEAVIVDPDFWIRGVLESQGVLSSPCAAATMQGSNGVAMSWVDAFSPGTLSPIPGTSNLQWSGVDETADLDLFVTLIHSPTVGLPYGVVRVGTETFSGPDDPFGLTLVNLLAPNVGVWQAKPENTDYPSGLLTLTT